MVTRRRRRSGWQIKGDERRANPTSGSGDRGTDGGRYIIDRLSVVTSQVETITFDNGKEFAYHARIAEALNCKVYFALPYHS